MEYGAISLPLNADYETDCGILWSQKKLFPISLKGLNHVFCELLES